MSFSGLLEQLPRAWAPAMWNGCYQGTLALGVVFLLIHYWKRILLFFAPWMGGFGRSIQQRWAKPEGESGH